MGHHDPEGEEREQDLRTEPSCPRRRVRQEEQREEGEGHEDDPHALLDDRVEEDRGRPHVDEQAEGRDPPSEHPLADREDGRGDREQPDHRLEPEEGDLPIEAGGPDQIRLEHVPERIEGIRVRESADRSGLPEPRRRDLIGEGEVVDRVAAVDDPVRRGDRIQEEQGHGRRDQIRRLRDPPEGRQEGGTGEGEERQEEKPRDADDAGFQLQGDRDHPEESDEGEAQGREIEKRDAAALEQGPIDERARGLNTSNRSVMVRTTLFGCRHLCP